MHVVRRLAQLPVRHRFEQAGASDRRGSSIGIPGRAADDRSPGSRPMRRGECVGTTSRAAFMGSSRRRDCMTLRRVVKK